VPWPEKQEQIRTTATAAVTAEHRAFWSFVPVKKVAAPAVQDGAWPRNDIDRFVLAKLEAANLKPAQPADKRTWIRRVTLDLTGLPPTPEESRRL
jgi:hypothetical protein